MYVLVLKSCGDNFGVRLANDEAALREIARRHMPELRNGRVDWQDFGYKRAVVSEDGRRVFEIFEGCTPE